MPKRRKNEPNVQIFFWSDGFIFFVVSFVDLMQNYCMIHVKKWLQSFHTMLVFTHVQHYYCYIIIIQNTSDIS